MKKLVEVVEAHVYQFASAKQEAVVVVEAVEAPVFVA